jgi:hypothetical protein
MLLMRPGRHALSNCRLCNRSRQRRNPDNVRPLSFLEVGQPKRENLPSLVHAGLYSHGIVLGIGIGGTG